MPEITCLAFTSLVERAQSECHIEEAAADLMALLDKVEIEMNFSTPSMAEALRMLELSTAAIKSANATAVEYF